MLFLYSTGYTLYKWALFAASLFNAKAKKWRKGRGSIYDDLANISNSDRIAWFHAASLGEFEMARPVIERFKKAKPDFKLLVTFFSPSGYEARHNDPLIDFASYFPHDHKKDMNQFLEFTHPEIAVFVKYEFWPNALKACLQRDIPISLISSTFRENHFIFKGFGKPIQELLKKFRVISTQNELSKELLLSHGFTNVVCTGDGRFDNVLKLALTKYDKPELDAFIDRREAFIAGSCWKEDEDVVLPQIMGHPSLKFILVPHDISEGNIRRLEHRIPAPFFRWSQRKSISNPEEYRVLIVDTIGELRAMYSKANIAFVGGGYKTGLHNILEPASYGLPVLFGPLHQKFWEAQAMIDAQGALEIRTKMDLKKQLKTWVAQPQKAEAMGTQARLFVENHRGAGDAITALLLQQVN